MKKSTIIFASIFACVALSFTSCKKSNVEINDISDLTGLKIGVQAGTTGDTWCQENVKGVKLSSFKSGIDAALDLKNGTLDAVVIDELPAIEIVNQIKGLKIVRDPYFAENKEEYAIAVKKGNKALLESINTTISDIKSNGKYDLLIQSFMPADGTIKVPTFVKKDFNKKVVLGTDANFPPFEYVEGKNVVGFDVAFGELIAETYGAKLEIMDMSFDSLIPALASGAIDFIAAGMSVTEERKKNVDFSDAYFSSEQVIIVRK